jgi:mono/diheme cytochrome c family protein
VKRFFSLGMLVVTAACSVGCGRAPDLKFTSSKEVQSLDAKLQRAIVEQLEHNYGTPTRPKLPGQKGENAQLQRGAEIYQSHCAACHGVTGDGAGPVAAFMYPRPRDYRRGTFKFTSTPYGFKPIRDDLLRTVRQGARGTSMPSFALFPEDDLQAVVDYVMVLTNRGELEILLASQAESDDEVDLEAVPGLAADIHASWEKAKQQTVEPLTREPPYTRESIELGKKAFLSETAICHKCHGEDGRGQTSDNLKGFVDSWGFQTRAADLSAGMFHGGQRSADIYRRIYSGINGTPMPSFQAKLADQPETFWHLVHYVQFISSARRREVVSEYNARKAASASAAGEGG